jgi:hypothetical protein
LCGLILAIYQKEGVIMVMGYCVKCKEKNIEMGRPAIHKTQKGSFMAKGICPECGTTMCAMISQSDAQRAIQSGATKHYQ